MWLGWGWLGVRWFVGWLVGGCFGRLLGGVARRSLGPSEKLFEMLATNI